MTGVQTCALPISRQVCQVKHITVCVFFSLHENKKSNTCRKNTFKKSRTSSQKEKNEKILKHNDTMQTHRDLRTEGLKFSWSAGVREREGHSKVISESLFSLVFWHFDPGRQGPLWSITTRDVLFPRTSTITSTSTYIWVLTEYRIPIWVLHNTITV